MHACDVFQQLLYIFYKGKPSSLELTHKREVKKMLLCNGGKLFKTSWQKIVTFVEKKRKRK